MLLDGSFRLMSDFYILSRFRSDRPPGLEPPSTPYTKDRMWDDEREVLFYSRMVDMALAEIGQVKAKFGRMTIGRTYHYAPDHEIEFEGYAIVLEPDPSYAGKYLGDVPVKNQISPLRRYLRKNFRHWQGRLSLVDNDQGGLALVEDQEGGLSLR